jgi:hypothetical protein
MTDTLDLTGEIAEAIDGAVLRGHAVVVGYVDDAGYASMSYRGSTQVYGPQQLALWARKRSDGLVAAIAERPKVSLLYYDRQGPGAKYLSIRGVAHVDESASDAVYERMVEPEQGQDPDRKGVAVIVDVESVNGLGAHGPLSMQR